MAKEDKEDKKYDIVEVTETFGRFQIMQFIYCCLPALFVTMININYVFTVGDVNYRCRIPECDSNTTSIQRPVWWPDTAIDRCSRPVLHQDWNNTMQCTNASFSGSVEKCDSWVYESNDTVVAELDLACQPWTTNSVGTVHSAGMVISMTIFGWLSDKYGRKPTLVLCSVGGILGHLKTFVTSYYLYIVIEFLEAAITGGTYSAAMVIMIESSGKNNRVLAGVIFAYAIYVGEAIFACIAIAVTYWKTLIRIICTPPIIFLSYTFLIRESPRWQIINNKFEEAKKTLLVIAETNKLNIDKQEFLNIDGAKLKNKFNLGSHEQKESMKTVFTSKEIWKRLLVMMICRFTASFVYYGMMINSVWLPGNKYTNFLLATVMSFPGELIALVLMNKYGRRKPLLYGYLACGVLCIASGYVPEGLELFRKRLGKDNSVPVGEDDNICLLHWCCDVHHGTVPDQRSRHTDGAVLLYVKIWRHAGPAYSYLDTNISGPAIPLVRASAVVSGISLILTPETRNLPLMDTVEQVETSAKHARDMKRTQGNTNAGFDDTVVSSL
ncbi:hypothetical protein MSG28_013396 [Choristoneura fumiferana]|uniref:Uncharacterized protein n=1 Tax=Choristoneura fumiferana TaxID=7141 RepID=A0ACC0KT99_CHOFU|nr:hypothetical protein MSG28_013396 [Choristoneura fumiferana]